ncbi:MAG TPA: hypothetical protein VK694_07140 [Verrucomicrobiae bacterium]|nr:hypothetical protein [Verrucomicrobiae bacterium]
MNPNEPQNQQAPQTPPAAIPVHDAPAPEPIQPRPLLSNPPTEALVPSVPPANPTPVVTPQPAAPPPINAVYSMGSIEAKQANHRTRQLIALAVITVALALIGGGVILMLQMNNHSPENHTPTQHEAMP